MAVIVTGSPAAKPACTDWYTTGSPNVSCMTALTAAPMVGQPDIYIRRWGGGFGPPLLRYGLAKHAHRLGVGGEFIRTQISTWPAVSGPVAMVHVDLPGSRRLEGGRHAGRSHHRIEAERGFAGGRQDGRAGRSSTPVPVIPATSPRPPPVHCAAGFHLYDEPLRIPRAPVRPRAPASLLAGAANIAPPSIGDAVERVRHGFLNQRRVGVRRLHRAEAERIEPDANRGIAGQRRPAHARTARLRRAPP